MIPVNTFVTLIYKNMLLLGIQEEAEAAYFVMEVIVNASAVTRAVPT